MADDAGSERVHASTDVGGSPSVLIRKASTDVGADDDEDTRQQQQTPAPMASFEALSDAENSDEERTSNDIEDDNAEALRELATTLDIPTGGGAGRQQHAAGGTKSKKSSNPGSNGTSLPTSTSSDPLPPPPTPTTAGNDEDRYQLNEDDEDDDTTGDPFATDDVIAGITAEMAPARNSSSQVNVPTLVFDAAPDEVHDDDEQLAAEQPPETAPVDQTMWAGWIQDSNDGLDQSWITFEKDEDDEDNESQSTAAASDDQSNIAKPQAPDRPARPPTAKPGRPPPPAGPLTSKTTPTGEGGQLPPPENADLDLLDEDDDLPIEDKKKSKIKLSLSPKKLMKNISSKKDKKNKDSSSDKKSKSKSDEATASKIAAAPAVKREFVPPKTDSEEWKKFQEMQDRINQVLMKTSEKVNQMEQGFQTELDKLNVESQKAQSPWIIVGAASDQQEADVKSPDRDEVVKKSSSWVGFDDTFEAEVVATVEDESAATEICAEECNEAPVDVDTSVDQVVGDEPTEAVESQVAGNEENGTQQQQQPEDDGVDPFQTDYVVETNEQPAAQEQQQEPEVDQKLSPTQIESPKTEAVRKEPEPEPEQDEEEDVDPFDVSNVVTAMTSGKPLSEVIDDAAEKAAQAKKQKEDDRRRAAEEQRLIESTGGRARPRPRPQAAYKSANPFKIALAATSIDTAGDDDNYEVEDNASPYSSSYTAPPLSSANPFAPKSIAVDDGVDDWDLLSGVDSAVPALPHIDGSVLWSTSPVVAAEDSVAFEADFSTTVGNDRKDKDSDSIKSSKSSIDEPTEPLEPLDPFYPKWDGTSGWVFFLRTPLKKKLTKNRTWKQIFVRLVAGAPNDPSPPRLKVFGSDADSAVCFHELSMDPSCALRRMELQQFDQYSKCHTVKVEHLAYVEKLAIKGDRIAPTVRDLTRVRDLKGLKDLMHKPKTTMVFCHSASPTDSFKFGTLDYVAYKQFIRAFEDVQFAMSREALMRGKIPNSYTKDEVVIDMIDEYYADIEHTGHISYHKARVRMFCISFLSGKPVIEIGINDRKRRGNEIVGRADIIPIKTEDWIRYEDVELNAIVDAEEYEKTRIIKLSPPDACRVELLRFRVRPRANVELPLQINVQMSTADPRRIEIRADLVIPGYYSTSRRASQVACEDIQIRFPIPESLVYMFRVERRFKYGSVHSAKKKPGRIKGLERLAGLAGVGQSSSSGSGGQATNPIEMQASSGLAKYEHVFRSVVWRISRLPERNQGAYKTHLFLLKLDLGAHDTPPTDYAHHVHVEYKMSDCTASRAQVRSVSLSGQYYEEPPDRWVRHLSRYEYTVEIDFTEQLKAPTQTDAPEIDDMMLPSAMASMASREAGGSSGASSAGDSTAEDSSASSDSDSD